jgi:cob(I)alamin adenosyltransferase
MYLNRLGDWLFVQARFANAQSGTSDIPWLAK